ncbi:DUF6716 putative glycosyltransferase [Streptomyces sp. NPDC032472]|uniref:DUF6716 putative glycosyltransferase n=1 Tax=Streptomyces sp. NPDC032472 TaxID=3155018 RepID=UPI00340ED764
MPVSNHADTRRGPKVAVLADSDTRWKWGALTARRLAPDHRLTGYLLRGRATPTARQLGEVGVAVDAGRLSEVTCPEFLDRIVGDRPDVIVLALVGGAVQAVLHGIRALWPAPAARPVVVTGYVGVVYEKLADGLLLRHGADLVLANSRHDAERFRAVYEGVGAAAESVTETALPFLDGAPYRPAGSRARRVVFAVQPSVPDSRADRAYLLRRAAGHARLHPDREVLVKLRSRPGEHTTHLEEQPYQRLAERVPGGLPVNCRLVYGNMGEVLDGTDLLVTVSSTAALESLYRGIPTAVLTDLGIREALGNHHFLGSGCLASWDQLDAGLLPEASPAWLSAHGVRPAPPPTAPAPTARAVPPRPRAGAEAGAGDCAGVASAAAEAGSPDTGTVARAAVAEAGDCAEAAFAVGAAAGPTATGEAGTPDTGTGPRSGARAEELASASRPRAEAEARAAVAEVGDCAEAAFAVGAGGASAAAEAGAADAGTGPRAGGTAPGLGAVRRPGAGAQAAADPYAVARARVAELAARPWLPPVEPYYTLATAPGYLPGILARQHLAPDGTPLPGALRGGEGRSRVGRWFRGRLREAARGAYRHGVQRVAPAIRRLGDL